MDELLERIKYLLNLPELATPEEILAELEKAVARLSAAIRNTPTGVGKTPPRRVTRQATGKHPHGRGEDLRLDLNRKTSIETPPRAWGRRDVISDSVAVCGNPPTGVGKTHRRGYHARDLQKHPHGRGEDGIGWGDDAQAKETPPRAWGRQSLCYLCTATWRNTPTGVGKTP